MPTNASGRGGWRKGVPAPRSRDDAGTELSTRLRRSIGRANLRRAGGRASDCWRGVERYRAQSACAGEAGAGGTGGLKGWSRPCGAWGRLDRPRPALAVHKSRHNRSIIRAVVGLSFGMTGRDGPAQPDTTSQPHETDFASHVGWFLLLGRLNQNGLDLVRQNRLIGPSHVS
jgi:hypothetical protein